MVTKYEQFSASISSIYHDIQRIERVEMEKFGLKGPHAQCLLVLSRYPEGITAANLCEVCEKDKAAISRSLSELEAAGLVCREDRNGSRYRAKLRLTEQGANAAQTVSRKAQLTVELAGAGLDNGQREIFYRVLELIAGNLHTICRDGLKE